MKFNQTKDSVAERTRTNNNEGGEAFNPDNSELALTKVVINNLLESTYYESAEEQLESVEQEFDACADENPEFVLKLAKYARQEENLRQVPQALIVLAANDSRTQEFVRDYATGIMSRTDEPLDVLAFHIGYTGSKSIPNCLQKSIEDAMHTWNEWQYAKWDQPNKEFQYRDLLNLVHPKPREGSPQEDIFRKIAYGDLDDYDVEPLKQEDTWESSLSDDSDDRSKAEKYEEQLAEGNMGLFPRIRQARDMLEAGVSAEAIYGDVTDEWIRNSRLYPFRFYQAYKAVNGQGALSEQRDGGFGVGLSGGLNSSDSQPDIPENERRDALDFLEHAMEVSTENLPDVLEDTFVAVDTSGSMSTPISQDSDLECMEIGSLFGALVYQRGADLSAFASSIEEYNGDRRDTIPTLMKEIQGMPCGGGTSGYLVPKALREYDRDEYSQVIVFTDMQMYNGSFNKEWTRYKSEVNPDASLYLVDLNSYGDLVTPEGSQDVYQLSGWTENVIDFIDNMENIDGMIREIESVEPDQ